MQFPDEPHIVVDRKLRKLLRLSPIVKNSVIIEGLNLTVEKGSIVSLVGYSGAGKTTLLRIIAGLETRYKGKVLLNGERVVSPSRRIQIVFQDNRLLPWRNVKKNVSFALPNISKAERDRRVDTWIRNVRLTGKVDDLPKTLSGGEANRVAYARAFVDPPQVLLLDEPFRSLDHATKLELQEDLLDFAEKNETTVIVVSHSIDDAVFLSDRVIRLASDPLRIAEEVKIDVTRPRVRGDAHLAEITKQLSRALVTRQ